jgi:hypothetical protein
MFRKITPKLFVMNVLIIIKEQISKHCLYCKRPKKNKIFQFSSQNYNDVFKFKFLKMSVKKILKTKNCIS